MPNAAISTSLDESLRERYRQPKGVEQFGIEAIPEDRKTVAWYDLFSIIINFLVSPGTILRGGLGVVAGLSFGGAIAAEFLGIMSALICYVVMATVGVDYGIPGQVATRAVYGRTGAKVIPSFLRAIASCYWFAFQTFIGAGAIVAVLDKLTGTHHSLVMVSVMFGILQACVAVVGYQSLKALSRIALPVKIVVFVYLFVLLTTHNDPNFAPAAVLGYTGKSGWNWLLMAAWLNASAASWLTMITDASDFCRYSRSRADMWIGTLSAAAVGTFVSGALGAYGAAATLGKIANPFVVVANISNSLLTLGLVLVFIALDNWTINVLNLYTGGLSISNIFERLGRFWTTLIASVAGIALSAVPDVLNSYLSYATILGNFFAPIAGVLMFDYVVIKRMRLEVPALFSTEGRYRYWAGFNLVAVAWTAIGFVLYMFVIPMAWLPTLSTTLLTGVGYTLTAWLVAARSATMAYGSTPFASAPAAGD